MNDLQTQRDPTPQEEAEQKWAEQLAQDEMRQRSVQALRARQSSRIVHDRLRTAVLARRLLDANPRDAREPV